MARGGLPEIVQNFNAKNAWRFKPKKMLDDAGINCQLDLLAKRYTGPAAAFLTNRLPWFCSTFLHTRLKGGKDVSRWSARARVQLGYYDSAEEKMVIPGALQPGFYVPSIMFVPIHHRRQLHWTLLVVDFTEKKMTYCDSLGPPGDSAGRSRVMRIAQRLQHYIREDTVKRSGIEKYDFSGWRVDIPRDLPRQASSATKGNDCGVFVLWWVRRFMEDKPVRVKRGQPDYMQDTAAIRHRLLTEILSGSLQDG